MKKYLYIFYCIASVSTLLLSSSLKAQAPGDKILIKGKVTDAADKSAVIGSSVIEQDNDKRTVTGVATNIDGEFAIKISNPANKLSISFIGYKTVVLTIGTQRVFNIKLTSNNALNTIEIVSKPPVNNGTGLIIDERDRTTATATINAKDLEELQATSIDQALQGRLPGVDVVASSGDPGAGMSIKIRGTSSINGATNPLVVVDGLPYETQIPSDFNFQTADQQGYASLLSIAPSDIKDITILKDAASTAVWGARASNGVLIINTKRGQIGAPVITYTFKGSLNQQPTAIPLLNGNQYSVLIPEEVQNVVGTPINTLSAKEFEHDPNDPYYYYNYGQNTDWLKAISRNGYNYDNNLSITGGGEKARYFASVGYTSTTGTTLGTALTRLNGRLNLDYIVSTKIHFRTDVAYTHSITAGNFVDGKNEPNIRAEAQLKMPNQSIYEFDEYGHQTPNFFTPAINIQGLYLTNSAGSIYNPVAMALLATNNIYNDRVTPHFNLQYQILPALLTATADIQFDINTYKTATFLPQSATGRPFTETVANRAYNFDTDDFNVVSKTNFIYTPKLGENQTLQALLSIQTNDDKVVGQSLLTANTASTTLQDPSSPSRTQNSDLGVQSTLTETRSLAALISAQYSLLDRYIINVGLRGDGNSRFGPSQRYGLFPSISGRYRVSGEPFMKKFKNLDDFSIRASYGIAGNPPTKDYTFYNNYTNYNYTYLGLAGIYPSNIGLDNLRYEKVAGKNLGFNLILFNYRINFDAEIYQNRTTDLFFNNLAIASFNGYSSINLNVGTMDNQGYEISLNLTPVKTKKLVIDFSFNIAHNENVIRALSPYVATTTGSGTVNGSFISTLHIDNPLGSFYGYVYQGVYTDAKSTIATDKNGNAILNPAGQPVQMRFNYPSTNYAFQPGDAKYQDINHDGVIDSRDIVYLGNGNPKFTGGFGPTITWNRNWKLNAFFSYRTGFSIINSTEMTTTNLYNYSNQSTAVLRRWEKPGDITDIPRALFNSGYNWLGSSRYVQDGTFLRFSALTLRYNLDDQLAKRLGLKSAGVYVTGQNLYTWTRYIGQDPEVSPRADDIYQQPIDKSTTPAAKQYTIGLTASF